MSDWIEQVERARSHVRPNLAPQRMQAIRDGVQGELVSQGRRRAVAMVCAGLALLVLAGFAAQRLRIAPQAADLVAHGPTRPLAPAPLVLDDGSRVEPLENDARIETLESSPAKQAVRLAAGRARFDVTPRQKRSFEVQARDVTISVLGTAFVVAIEGGGVNVQVEHGHVRVSWPG